MQEWIIKNINVVFFMNRLFAFNWHLISVRNDTTQSSKWVYVLQIKLPGRKTQPNSHKIATLQTISIWRDEVAPRVRNFTEKQSQQRSIGDSPVHGGRGRWWTEGCWQGRMKETKTPQGGRKGGEKDDVNKWKSSAGQLSRRGVRQVSTGRRTNDEGACGNASLIIGEEDAANLMFLDKTPHRPVCL